MQETTKDPVKTFYLLGFNDVMFRGRKRRRPVGVMYKLAYTDGWFDAKLGRGNRYKDK
jgi:hypothetical protein